MERIGFIILPVPIGFVILWMLGVIGGIYPDNFPIFFWKLLIASGLVAFVYAWYVFWKKAFGNSK